MKLPFSFSQFISKPHSFLRGRRLSFKLGVVATLAIAIGANIAVLGNLGVLFGPTVPGATHRHFLEPWIQLTVMKALAPADIGIFRPIYDELAKTLEGRAKTALYQPNGGTLSVKGSPGARLAYLQVTPSLAQVLGIQPIAGRLLNPGDSLPGAAPVIVIGADLASARFGTARAAIGRGLTLDGKDYTVVGVLPGNLHFPSGALSFGHSIEAWLPFAPEAPGLLNSPDFNMHALVRPLAGLSNEAILNALQSAYRQGLLRYSAESREAAEQAGVELHVSTLAEREFGGVISHLQILETAAVLLLLLVLANLVGLATTDALARRQELATRAALGAGAWQLYWSRARGMLALGLIAWVIGMGLGWLGSRALAATVGQAGTAAVFSPAVLLMTLGAVIAIALPLSFAGLRRMLAPGAVAADIASGSRATGGRSMARTLRALVVVQLAASLILLATTAQLQSNVFGLTHGNLGFVSTHRTFFSVILPGGEGNQTQAQYEAYVKRASVFDRVLLARMQALPGIQAAAALSLAPLSEGDISTGIRSAPDASSQIINVQTVSSQIVPALGLKVIAGNPGDAFSATEDALLLDASAVRALWPKLDPGQAVGRSVYIDHGARRIAAVVEPLRMRPYGSVGGTAFLPMSAQHLSGGPQGFVVHSALATPTFHRELQDLVRKINPQARVTRFDTAQRLVTQAYAGRNRLSQIFGVVALITLVIAAVGLFALLAYRALVRRPEFAIRGALGATPARLFGGVLLEAGLLWLIGCVIGIPLAYMLSAQLAVRMPALGALAPWLAAAVAVALGLAATLAALIPALRASRVAPAMALRQE